MPDLVTRLSPTLFRTRARPPNTRDQLRGVHDLTLEHDDGADDSAPTRFQPPLVSCIALFGGAIHSSGSEKRTVASVVSNSFLLTSYSFAVATTPKEYW
jgi:hypothetical protein